MTNGNWKWANLSDEQLWLLNEGERTLGIDYLLAFQPGDPANVYSAGFSRFHLQFADLTESQLECLQGLEKKMNSTVVAYREA